MKKYTYFTIIVAILSLITVAQRSCSKVKYYKDLYERTESNVRAYESSYASLEDENRQFKFTIDELRSSKDSINQKLLAMSEKLKIKDKNINSLQYHSSVVHKTDTIILQDTVFRNINPIDTTIGDQWYNLDLRLEYPSTMVVSPTFKSEKYIIVNTKKEYNKTPSKIFFIRWFQKKHTTVVVDVVEENPYIENKEQRFIQIVKD